MPISSHLLGADALDRDSLSIRCIDRNHKFPSSFICRALAGVDTALWDIYGKLEGKSVCELLGGRPRPFPAYGSSMRRDTTPTEEAERLVRLRDSHGFDAFKLKIGSVYGHDRDQWPGRTEELISTVRNTLGDDVGILADANSCYTPRRAIEIGRVLEDNDGCHFEEPCPYWELEWTAEVAAPLDIPVPGGEQDVDLAQWRRMVDMNAVDIVQPDLCYVGGLTRALQVVGMAAEAGKPCVPHSANASMVIVFTLYMLGAIPNAGPYLEYSIESRSPSTNLYSPALVLQDGYVSILDGPDWGVTVNPKWLEEADYAISEID